MKNFYLKVEIFMAELFIRQFVSLTTIGEDLPSAKDIPPPKKKIK